MGGAIGKRGVSAPDQLRTYVNVDSIDATLSKVSQHGGTIVTEKAEVPGHGWFAVIQGTEGNEIALWESAPRG